MKKRVFYSIAVTSTLLLSLAVGTCLSNIGNASIIEAANETATEATTEKATEATTEKTTEATTEKTTETTTEKTTAPKWVQTNGRWWYDYGDGTYAKNEYIDGYWIDAAGWYNSAWNGSWHCNSTGWWFQSGSWYPKNSWLKVNGKWYYFDKTGYMKASDWIKDSGSYFYLTDTGAMAVSTKVGIYNVDENGVRVDPATDEELIAASETAKKTSQIVLVVNHDLTLWQKSKDGKWTASKTMYCGYGTNGFSNPEERVKGDRTTPLGAYELNYAFGRKENPGTEMTYRMITPYSYLSSEKETYNTWVESTTWVNGEHLIDYEQYDYAANIAFNVNPTVYGRGAGIFLHCKSSYKWDTMGCVSVEDENMVWLLQQLKNGAYILITEDRSEIRDY